VCVCVCACVCVCVCVYVCVPFFCFGTQREAIERDRHRAQVGVHFQEPPQCVLLLSPIDDGFELLPALLYRSGY